MRLTYHNGRAGRDGVYSTRHNDRNYDTSQDDHIVDDKSNDNIYWHCYQETDPDLTFEQAEAKFYAAHFGAALDERNERSRKQGHHERVQTIDDYRKSRKSCPEETEYAIGKLGDCVDPSVLESVYTDYLDYLMTYKNYRILNIAIHVDERGVGHIHERHVWVAHDDDGREIVHQSKSLAEMGVERPDVNKKEGRHNNAKQTWTAACRSKLQEICKLHNLELETEPKERSKTGLSMIEYQARQEMTRLSDAEKRADQAEQAQKEARNAVVSMLRELGNVTSATDLATWQQALADLGKEIGYRVQLPNLQQTKHQR